TAGFDVGFDLGTGFGLIQADQALARLFDQDPTAPDEPGAEPIGDEDAPPASPPPPSEDASPIELSTGEVIRGSNDDDVIRGGSGNDRLIGRGGNDRIRGAAGDDLLRGNAGRDRLIGQAGDDRLKGGNGDDRLRGGAGSDELTGGRGDDLLIGGADSDIFVLRNRQGTDLIRDFNIGEDVIRLQGSLSFGDVSFQQQGRNTVLEAGGETLATLRGVQAAQLDQASFV
ncbi:MAG: hypothetical protein AAFR31_09010, partial [Cyanobacteria bacterium J06627_8]